MIFRIGYAGERIQEKDGKRQKVLIPPPYVLQRGGPMLEIVILPPKVIREKLEQGGKKIPGSKLKALIDTGAHTSVIIPEIADKLNLIHTGYQKVISVQDEQIQPEYFGTIEFPWGSRMETRLLACPLREYQCLIGRDVLVHWHLTYDGGAGLIVICD